MAEPNSNIGWRFEALHPGGSTTPLHFATGGTVGFELSRDVPKAISGLVLVPQERIKVDFVQDQVNVFMVINDVDYPMGVFSFTEDVLQKDVVLDPEQGSTDLTTVSLGDRFARLIRNDGSAQTLLKGFDPSFEMREILARSGLPYSVAGAASNSASDVTWDGNTTDLQKVKQLATLSGHRPPWMGNQGIIRSVAALVVETDVITMESLFPTAGTVSITNNYLIAPNRVIVSDNSFPSFALRGQWDAPGSTPHSEGKRGFVYTKVEDVQGLGSGEHATTVARSLGESYTARKLSAQIVPTDRLDGPQVISYDGALWLVNSWSVGTDPGSTMSFQAEELLA